MMWDGLSGYIVPIHAEIQRRHLTRSSAGPVRRRAFLDHFALPPEIRADHTVRTDLCVWHRPKERAVDPNHRLHRGRRASDRFHRILSHSMYASPGSVDPRDRSLRRTACRVARDWHSEPHHRCHHLQRSDRVGCGSADELAQQDCREHSAVHRSDVSP